jgi:hypothetical protein
MQALKSNLTDWRPLHHMVLDKQVASTPALLGRSAMNHTKNRQRTGQHKKKNEPKAIKTKRMAPKLCTDSIQPGTNLFFKSHCLGSSQTPGKTDQGHARN